MSGTPRAFNAQSLQNRLRGATNPRAALSKARSEAAPSQFSEMVAAIRRNTYIAQRVWANQHQLTYARLGAAPTLDSLPLAAELRWAAAHLTAHAEQLNTFVSLSASFNAALLGDAHRHAAEILDQVESQFGASLWLIKRRIAFLQSTGGLEAQKRFVARVRAESGDRGIAPFVAFYASVRSEPSVTPAGFRAKFDRDMATFALPQRLGGLLQHHLAPSTISQPDALAELLVMEERSSMVDYYEAFLAVARFAAADGTQELQSALATALRSLIKRVGDARASNCLALLGLDAARAVVVSDVAVRSADAWVEGDPVGAHAEALAAIDSAPADPSALLSAALALTINGDKLTDWSAPLARRLARQLAAVLRKDATATDDNLALTKLANEYDGEPWADLLYAVVESESSDEPEAKTGSFAHLAALNTITLHPFLVDFLPVGQPRRLLAQLLSAKVVPGSALQYVAVAADAADGEALSRAREAVQLLSSARRDLRSGDFAAALGSAQALIKSRDRFFAARGVRIAARALLALGRLGECVRLVAHTAARERTWHGYLPIIDLALAVVNEPSTVRRADIGLPILFDLRARYGDHLLEAERVFALRDFLEAHGITRPSQLSTVGVTIDADELIFFLRFVCVESVLDRTGLFDTSSSILEERVNVCRLLVELDPGNEETYRSEIKALLRSLVVKRRMREIEQSRVYVDTDSIKRTVEDELREAYSRYLDLRRQSPPAGGMDEVRTALRRAAEGDAQQLAALSLPKDETSQVFESIVLRLLNEYYNSPEHGLDKYLSVRIRHGTLAAQLRKPLDAAQLITSRVLGGSGFQPNEYWAAYIQTGDDNIRRQVAERLALFSGEYDAFVEAIRGWIRLRRDASSGGMFEYGLSGPQLRLMIEYVGDTTPYEEFVDYILEQFGILLDSTLDAVRARINEEGKARAAAFFNRLINDVERLTGQADVGELLHAIRTAHGELRATLERVAGWFVRARAVGNEPFTLEEAITVSVETVRAIRGDFDAKVDDPQLPDLHLQGALFPVFVDIFFIMFENIVKHSRTTTTAAADVTLQSNRDVLVIRVENDVAIRHLEPEWQERIDTIKRDIARAESATAVSREGGTGLHKLARILSHELGIDVDLDFGLTPADRFFVQFSAPMRVETE